MTQPARTQLTFKFHRHSPPTPSDPSAVFGNIRTKPPPGLHIHRLGGFEASECDVVRESLTIIAMASWKCACLAHLADVFVAVLNRSSRKGETILLL